MFLRKALDAKGKNLTRDDVKLFNKLGIALAASRESGKRPWRNTARRCMWLPGTRIFTTT